MSMKIEIEFFDVSEKLPDKSCKCIVLLDHGAYMAAVTYSHVHKKFNALDWNTEEEVAVVAFNNVKAWAILPVESILPFYLK